VKSCGAANAHVMALQHHLDGCDVSLEEGIDVILTSPWGVALICPPKPVVLYKAEDPADRLFLSPRKSGQQT
jgi:hypothetical protein